MLADLFTKALDATKLSTLRALVRIMKEKIKDDQGCSRSSRLEENKGKDNSSLRNGIGCEGKSRPRRSVGMLECCKWMQGYVKAIGVFGGDLGF